MINVLRNLGGAGGTIVGKALSACGAFVFSETNPRSATILNHELNALVQLRRHAPAHVPPFWRNIDVNTLGAPRVFEAFMREAMQGFAMAGRPVVVRDHSYADFIGVPFVWPAPTRSSLDAALAPIAPLRNLALVRHPVATFRSLRTHPHYHWCLDGPTFVDGAIRFLTAFQSAPSVRYEDFVSRPDETLEQICGHLEVAYAPGWREKMAWAIVASGHPAALASEDVTPPAVDSDDWINHRTEMCRSPRYDELIALSGYADMERPEQG